MKEQNPDLPVEDDCADINDVMNDHAHKLSSMRHLEGLLGVKEDTIDFDQPVDEAGKTIPWREIHANLHHMIETLSRYISVEEFFLEPLKREAEDMIQAIINPDPEGDQ